MYGFSGIQGNVSLLPRIRVVQKQAKNSNSWSLSCLASLILIRKKKTSKVVLSINVLTLTNTNQPTYQLSNQSTNRPMTDRPNKQPNNRPTDQLLIRGQMEPPEHEHEALYLYVKKEMFRGQRKLTYRPRGNTVTKKINRDNDLNNFLQNQTCVHISIHSKPIN